MAAALSLLTAKGRFQRASRRESTLVEVQAKLSFIRKRSGSERRTCDESGQSLVEFAMILPAFLLVVTGIFAFGVAFTNWLVLTDATSLGGRTVAISRGNTLDPCATASTAVAGASPGLNTGLITYTSVINGTTYNGTTCNSSSTTTGAAGNLLQGGSYVLTTSYPCHLTVFGQNLITNCTMHAAVKELVQ
jgi:Flp pilus assembly protein TadG